MNDSKLELATLGGGCFWCLEAVYQLVRGVSSIASGYSGGHVAHPSYQQVCSETTGHAEVVQISFDPGIITYKEILNVFFSIHDPTTLNRQGYDIGKSYRSVIFGHNAEQETIATTSIKELDEARLWDNPIVTEVYPLSTFYLAEDYHQEFYLKNEFQPYCQVVISPKVSKFRAEHLDKLKPTTLS